MRWHLRLAIVAAVLVCAAPAGAARAAVCAEGAHPRGEWPTYGHDLTNSRSQPAENRIGPENVGTLEAAWVHDATGAINNTPIVTGGCVFVASSDGTVSALDADDGSKIWSTTLPVKQPAFGGGLVGSPAVTADSVLVAINEEGSPHLASLERATGKERWRTTIDEQKTSGTNASVVVYRGLAFVGFFGSPAPGDSESGGFVLIDAGTGKLVKRTYTIDGRSRTVNFHAKKTRPRAIVAILRPGRGKHRVKLVNLGRGRGGREVAVDALAVKHQFDRGED